LKILLFQEDRNKCAIEPNPAFHVRFDCVLQVWGDLRFCKIHSNPARLSKNDSWVLWKIKSAAFFYNLEVRGTSERVCESELLELYRWAASQNRCI